MTISSLQNPKVKDLVALQQKSQLRRERGLTVVEGRRELEHCMAAGFEPVDVFVCPEIPGRGFALPGMTTYEVTSEVYAKMAYRGGTEGVIATVRTRNLGLADLRTEGSPLYIVLESVEKPGNLGAVLRSADAAGADGVIVCDPLCDIYNPNVVRASIGAIFTVPTVEASSEETIKWLKSNNIQILTAQLQDSSPYYDTPMLGGTAIVMGTESTGLSQSWRKAADAHIMIPMAGRLDSLNVSVSAAVLLFEAIRQRQESKTL